LKFYTILKAGSGTLVTACVFLLTTPQILRDFGIERFGYISLLLVLFSSASLLDLGLSRGVTYFVSKNKIDNKEKLSRVWQLVYLLFFWSVFIGWVAYFLLNKYFESMDNVPIELKVELLNSNIYIAATVLFVILHAVFRGVLEGFECFGTTSVIKIIMALLIFVMLYISPNFESTLVYAAQVFLLVRITLLLVIVKLVINRIKPVFIFRWGDISEIVMISWQASISSLSSTILNYIDRFLGGLYANPLFFGSYSLISDSVMRVLFIPGAISSVLYPSISKSDIADCKSKLRKATIYVLTAIIPIIIILNLVGSTLLKLWLDNEFEGVDISFYILILSIGLLFLSLSHVFYAFIQGMGHFSFTARLHLIELLVFTPIFVIVAMNYGLNGIVSVWLIRIIIDFLCMYIYQKAFVSRC
jgi:O-antigen/teichoic acid export membrane protein